jgi:ribose transport system substrate-binding protein
VSRIWKPALAAIASMAVAGAVLAGCERGSLTSLSPTTGSSTPGCPAAIGRVKSAVQQAEKNNVSWTGPTTGPRAVSGKTLIYVAQTMTNPGVAGVATGIQQAARAIGWNVRVLDGQGTPAGIQAALSQATALKPDGIAIGGFDPNSTAQQVQQAHTAHIPLIGWHAVADPGPSQISKLFTNITTRVEDVAKISADWIIAQSNGRAGIVLFTDNSIPFADRKAKLITNELTACPTVKLLATENIPIPDASNRTPQEVSSLISRFGSKWTYSAAINDLYFGDAAPAFRADGLSGAGAPFNIGAGDGDSSAFQRINSRQFQAATVPEPLYEQGWQIVDEFNRAFSGRPASGYVAPVHIATTANSVGMTTWDPKGYRQAYQKIWGN